MRRPLTFEQVRVRRAPGFERDGFTVPDLSPAITIVYGPNGVGKSTTARAIERLLWPGLASGERMLLEGGVRLGEERWVVEAEGGRSQWLRDGVLAPTPRLPAPEVHRRYRLALHDLLREEDGDFAAAILRESAGGLVRRLIPPTSEDEAVEALRWSLEQMLSQGITSFTDALADETALRAYAALADRGCRGSRAAGGLWRGAGVVQYPPGQRHRGQHAVCARGRGHPPPRRLSRLNALRQRRLMTKLPNATPRSQPSPVPASPSVTGPLVTTCALAERTRPAWASAVA